VNYFEFYDLPVSFQLDLALLKRKYYQISRLAHPDFHTLASDSQQEAMLEKSTINNRAYKTLSDFDQRLKYILELFGKLKQEGENKVPQDFLMEMMDLNENVMELEMEPSEESRNMVLKEIEEIEQRSLAAIKSSLDAENLSILSEEQWSELTDYYLKSRYLKRIRENVGSIFES
jgi:molecular chaperone HscB